jgi:hypothetical protein
MSFDCKQKSVISMIQEDGKEDWSVFTNLPTFQALPNFACSQKPLGGKS